MEKLMLRKAVLGMVGTNVYFVRNTETGEMFIVDPASDPDRISEMIRKMDGKLTAILLTHGHFDHILAVPSLVSTYHVPVYACRQEAGLLMDPAANLSGTMGRSLSVSFEPDHYLDDNEEFTCAGFHIKMLHTPGHTEGSCCYYIPDENILFSGDTLFCGSVGRTDFPGGSMAKIIDSLHRLVDDLPENTAVYPGHDSATTIGDEKRYNPFV